MGIKRGAKARRSIAAPALALPMVDGEILPHRIP
jgi:hypothetical protein